MPSAALRRGSDQIPMAVKHDGAPRIGSILASHKFVQNCFAPAIGLSRQLEHCPAAIYGAIRFRRGHSTRFGRTVNIAAGRNCYSRIGLLAVARLISSESIDLRKRPSPAGLGRKLEDRPAVGVAPPFLESAGLRDSKKISMRVRGQRSNRAGSVETTRKLVEHNLGPLSADMRQFVDGSTAV